MTDTTVTDDVRARVARGVALLDEKRPGWASSIDLSRLDIRSPWDCVLGQLFESHGTGLGVLQLFEGVDVGLGYDARVPDGTHDGYQAMVDDYTNLTAEWVRVITDRRATHEVTL